jgi:hypothetical protein
MPVHYMEEASTKFCSFFARCKIALPLDPRGLDERVGGSDDGNALAHC